MTKREVERLLRRLQTLMGLDHWRIDLDWGQEASGGNYGEVWRSYQYDDATIYLGESWRERDFEGIRYTLLHELGHILCRDLDRCARDLEKELGDAFPMYEKRYCHEIEGVVDRYALVIAGLLS